MENMIHNNKYGVLLTPDAKLHRQYFVEMCKLIGINVQYRAPKPNKHWNSYTEIESDYEPETIISCIFNDHPDLKTMKKLGWVSELTESAAIISVPYDLPGIQVGALFAVPGGLDGSFSRLFRVTEISNIMMYPASLTCNLVPEYPDLLDKSIFNYDSTSMHLLNEEDYYNA